MRTPSLLLTSLLVLWCCRPLSAGNNHGASAYHGYKPPSPLCAPFDDHEKILIPAHRRVPPGWVVVGYRHSGLYSGQTCELLVIQKLENEPGIEMNIAANQPIPPGWGIVRRFYSIHNHGLGLNTVRIRKL